MDFDAGSAIMKGMKIRKILFLVLNCYCGKSADFASFYKPLIYM